MEATQSCGATQITCPPFCFRIKPIIIAAPVVFWQRHVGGWAVPRARKTLVCAAT
jgi:hypothetical protein